MTAAIDKPERANIVEAMEGIFRPWFPPIDGVDTWAGWKAILKAADCLPMTASEIEFFKSVTGGRELPTEPVSEIVGACARRTGKDSIASVEGSYSAATFDQQGRLRPGERAVVMCIAPDRDQAKICLNYIRSYFTDIPALRAMVERETQYGFELNNLVDIMVATGNFRAPRGRPIWRAILDEAAFMSSEATASPDTELYAALRPGMLTLSGSRMTIISSPYRKSGLLWERYKKCFGQNDNKTLVIQASLRELNPTISQEKVDAEIAADPAKAVSEIFGKFRDDISGYVDLALIESAVDRGVTVRPPRNDLRYSSFCDPSGGQRDSFSCAVSHVEGEAVVLDCLIEIKAPFNPTAATEQIAQTLKSYSLTSTTGDKYAAQWTIDAFAKHGIRYQHSERDRSKIYADCLPLFSAGRARLLDNPRLVNQFASLERKTSSLGRDRIDHPVNGMDDLANSVAGSLVLAEPLERRRSTVDYNFWGRGYHIVGQHGDGNAEPSAEDNYAQAEKDFERRRLSGRDLAWFVAERERRRKAGKL
jgi:hypothetical protein